MAAIAITQDVRAVAEEGAHDTAIAAAKQLLFDAPVDADLHAAIPETQSTPAQGVRKWTVEVRLLVDADDLQGIETLPFSDADVEVDVRA